MMDALSAAQEHAACPVRGANLAVLDRVLVGLRAGLREVEAVAVQIPGLNGGCRCTRG